MSSFSNALRNIKDEDNIIIKKKKKKIKLHKSIEDSKKSSNKEYKHGPLIVVKKDMKDNLDETSVQKWLSTSAGFLEGLTSIHDQPTKLYDYQIVSLNNTAKFRAYNKSRQIGFSWGCIAGECVAKSHLSNDNTSVIISYNKDEAAEKILAANQLYETIPLEYQKKRVTNNKHSLVFRDSKGHTSRILSTAQRPPRGKGHNTDVYLDEFAFYQWADKIFTASAPVVSRGTGVFTIGSTPLGARGKFHDIMMNVREFPLFTRQRIPWWHCPDLCNNIQRAFREAPAMPTRERVEKFGLPTIVLLVNSMPIDDFQQEYELSFVDENVSYFPYEMLNACVYNTDKDEEEFDEVADKKGMRIVIDKFDKTQIELKYPKIKFFQCRGIEELAWRINNGEIRPNLVAGYDVGRKKDKSELTILEEIEIKDGVVLQVVRFTFQLDREKFDFQKNYLRTVLSNIPLKKLVIDAMGIGMNLAEDLHTEFPDIVEELTMEGVWKERTAQSMKIRFENQIIAIPDDEQLKKQIGSIKKKVSVSGNVSYDAEKDKEHHGDKFWSLALASYAGTSTSNMNLGDSFKTGNRLIHNISNKKNNRIRDVFDLPDVYSFTDRSFEIPGMGRIPEPITGLLTPGDFINPGSTTWLNGFHTRTGRR